MKTNIDTDHAASHELQHDLKGIKIYRISTVPCFMVSQLRSQSEYLRNLGVAGIALATTLSSALSAWLQFLIKERKIKQCA